MISSVRSLTNRSRIPPPCSERHSYHTCGRVYRKTSVSGTRISGVTSPPKTELVQTYLYSSSSQSTASTARPLGIGLADLLPPDLRLPSCAASFHRASGSLPPSASSVLWSARLIASFIASCDATELRFILADALCWRTAGFSGCPSRRSCSSSHVSLDGEPVCLDGELCSCSACSAFSFPAENQTNGLDGEPSSGMMAPPAKIASKHETPEECSTSRGGGCIIIYDRGRRCGF